MGLTKKFRQVKRNLRKAWASVSAFEILRQRGANSLLLQKELTKEMEIEEGRVL